MKKRNRVLSHEEFVEIEKKGRSTKTPNFAVFIRGGRQNLARIGISVSKKNGNAVRRNRIKRQLRSMIDKLIDLTHPIDIIVIARKSYDPGAYWENARELGEALAKLGEKS